jgi:hypothetical protein
MNIIENSSTEELIYLEKPLEELESLKKPNLLFITNYILLLIGTFFKLAILPLFFLDPISGIISSFISMLTIFPSYGSFIVIINRLELIKENKIYLKVITIQLWINSFISFIIFITCIPFIIFTSDKNYIFITTLIIHIIYFIIFFGLTIFSTIKLNLILKKFKKKIIKIDQSKEFLINDILKIQIDQNNLIKKLKK